MAGNKDNDIPVPAMTEAFTLRHQAIVMPPNPSISHQSNASPQAIPSSITAASTRMTQQDSDSSEEDKYNKAGDSKAAGTSSKGKKTKRTQYSSCDACRLRKVRCIRESDSVDCNSCRNKNISCTRLFSEKHAHGKGKRINAARDKFGTLVDTDASTASPKTSSDSTSPSESAIVPSGTAFKLNEKVLSAKALSAFMHAYETDVQPIIPTLLDFKRLFQACEEVQFDLDALDDLDRVLSIAASAVAANIQQADRRFGVGQSAIAIRDPVATKRDLETRVLLEADRLGILRRPSLRAMEALRLFCMLTSGDDARKRRRSDSFRAYEQALVEHLRTLSERAEITEQKTAEFFWSTVLGDSFACALSGRSPSYTSDDIEIFASFVDYSTEGMLRIIAEMDLTSSDAGFGLIFAAICQLCRAFYHRVTSVRARRRPFVDIDIMEEIIRELERITGVLEVCEQKLDMLWGKGKWPDTMGYWARMVRFLNTFIMTMALDELEAAIVKELSGNVSLQRLYSLQQAFEKLQICTMRELKANVGWVPKNGSNRILATADGLMAYLAVIRLQRIFKLPTVEEGAAVNSWSIHEKVEVVGYYLKVCEYLGTAVPEVEEDMEDLRRDMAQLKERAKSFANITTNFTHSVPMNALYNPQPTGPPSHYTQLPNATGLAPIGQNLGTQAAPLNMLQSKAQETNSYRFEDISAEASAEATAQYNFDTSTNDLPSATFDFDFLSQTLESDLFSMQSLSSSSGSSMGGFPSPNDQFEQFLSSLQAESTAEAT